jgi:DNA-binding NarL/FixJ family response regulator
VVPVRVVVVEDHEQFRRFICSTLERAPELQVVGIVSDGVAAVQKAEELHPDLILLDIGLPKLNGIEAARRIRRLSPETKILFVSQESSADIAGEALGTGAFGYVVKSDAGSDLLKAVSAVLRGEQFVGKRFSGHDLVPRSDAVASQEFRTESAAAPLQPGKKMARSHEAVFYSDGTDLLDDLTRFVAPALKSGNAAVVVATMSHQDGLLSRLQACVSDIDIAIEQGRYISFDAADALSTFMINGSLDPVQFLNLFGNLIAGAAEAATGEQSRVAFFGEGVQLLWGQGNAEAAVLVERLSNQMANLYDVDIRCGYSLNTVQIEVDNHIFQRICAEHSAVHSL